MTADPLSGIARPNINPKLMFRWEPSQNAWLLLYPEGVIKLNPVAGEILRRCDGGHSIDAMLDELVTCFDATEGTIRTESLAFLRLAFERGWVVSGS